METASFYTETPVLKGKDAKRFVNKMANVKQLPRNVIDRIAANAAQFEGREIKEGISII
jgi:hypothetical protein